MKLVNENKNKMADVFKTFIKETWLLINKRFVNRLIYHVYKKLQAYINGVRYTLYFRIENLILKYD